MNLPGHGRSTTCRRCYHPLAKHEHVAGTSTALHAARCATAGCPCWFSWDD